MGVAALLLLAGAVAWDIAFPRYRQFVAKATLKEHGYALGSEYHGPKFLPGPKLYFRGNEEDADSNRLRKPFYDVIWVRWGGAIGDHYHDSDLRLLKAFPKLNKLELCYCEGLTDAGLAHLAVVDALEGTRASRSRSLGETTLAPLAAIRCLRSLEITYEEIPPAALVNLGRLTRIRSLHLDWNNDTDQKPELDLAFLGNLQQLETLELEVEERRSTAFSHLAQLKKLRFLSLSWIPYSEEAVGLGFLNGMEQLEMLEMYGLRRF